MAQEAKKQPHKQSLVELGRGGQAWWEHGNLLVIRGPDYNGGGMMRVSMRECEAEELMKWLQRSLG